MAPNIEYNADDDSYAILDVRPNNCDEATLKRVYRRLILQLHPDKQPLHARELAHEPFVRMQNAFEVLDDARKRRKYNAQREQFFRDGFKKQQQFSDYEAWKSNKEAHIWDLEEERKRQYNALREQWRKEAEAQQREASEGKEEQKRRQQKHKEKQQEQNCRHDQEQKRRQQEAVKENITLLEEKTSMHRDFRVWGAKQKEFRELEVHEREAQRREMQQLHEQARKDFEQTQAEKMAAFLERQKQEKGAFLKKHERDLASLRERQEVQRETQRQKRKLVRDEYDLWQSQTTENIKNIERGLPHRHKRMRPGFYRPSYGFTKNGQRCQKCVQAGGFCKQHKDQGK